MSKEPGEAGKKGLSHCESDGSDDLPTPFVRKRGLKRKARSSVILTLNSSSSSEEGEKNRPSPDKRGWNSREEQSNDLSEPGEGGGGGGGSDEQWEEEEEEEGEWEDEPNSHSDSENRPRNSDVKLQKTDRRKKQREMLQNKMKRFLSSRKTVRL